MQPPGAFAHTGIPMRACTMVADFLGPKYHHGARMGFVRELASMRQVRVWTHHAYDYSNHE